MRFLVSFVVWLLALPGLALADVLEFYIDGDYSVHPVSARSIELGVRTALSEVDYRIGGVEVVVVPKDNRGNVKRSHLTMKAYAKSDRALVLVGGLHSPPYLRHREFLNENSILTALPWSAAGPITRAAQGRENWIFRLSVDDTKSGDFLVQEAVERHGCEAISLVLLDTAWGRSNSKNLTKALAQRGMNPSLISFFPTTVDAASAQALAEAVHLSGADCAIMLSGGSNGALVSKALFIHTNGLRVLSHWGIMGDHFAGLVPHEIRHALGLRLLQTCGLRREMAGSAVLKHALMQVGPDAESLASLPAPTGFVHGFDLTRLLIAAADQASATPQWQGDIQSKRAALRAALERLHRPVTGILKTYDRPFGPYTQTDPDAHEALGLSDLCMARFDQQGLLEDAR